MSLAQAFLVGVCGKRLPFLSNFYRFALDVKMAPVGGAWSDHVSKVEFSGFYRPHIKMGFQILVLRYIKSICCSLKLQLRFIKCNLTVHQYFICKELLLMRYPGTFFGRLQCAGLGRHLKIF